MSPKHPSMGCEINFAEFGDISVNYFHFFARPASMLSVIGLVEGEEGGQAQKKKSRRAEGWGGREAAGQGQRGGRVEG